jgi:hypothetical protein
MKRSIFITTTFKLIGYCTVDINCLGTNSHRPPTRRDIPQQGPGPSQYPSFTITIGIHNTSSRTPLGEWSARSRDLYLTTQNSHPCSRRDSKPQSQQASERRPTSQTARPPRSFRVQAETIFGLIHKNLYLAATSFITNGVLKREIVLKIFDVLPFTAMNMDLLKIQNIHYSFLAAQ